MIFDGRKACKVSKSNRDLNGEEVGPGATSALSCQNSTRHQ